MRDLFVGHRLSYCNDLSRSCHVGFLGLIIIGIALLLPISAHAQGEKVPKNPFDGAERLVDPEDPEVEAKNKERIEHIEQSLSFIETASECMPDLEDSLKEIVAKMRAALKSGRVFKGDFIVMGSSYGSVRGGQRASETKEVVLNDLLLVSSPCTPAFMFLVGVLIHEGKHVCVGWDEEPANTETETVLNWKLGRIRNEMLARHIESNVLSRITALLSRMTNNLVEGRDVFHGFSDDEKKCMDLWKDCSLPNLRGLNSVAAGVVRGNETILEEAFTVYLKNDFSPKDIEDIKKELEVVIDGTDDDLVDYIEADHVVSRYAFHASGDRFQFLLDSERGIISLEPGSEGSEPFRVPDINFPQDAALLRDVTGHPWLLVIGYNDRRTPSGSIVVLPAEEAVLLPAPSPLPIPRPGEDPVTGGLDPSVVGVKFSNPHHRTLTSSNPNLPHPTAIVQLRSGRVLVWDPKVPGLFALLDTDEDGLPDSLGTDNQISARLPKGERFEISRLASARVAGDGNDTVVIGLRLLAVVHDHGLRELYLRDLDGDGHFERSDFVRPAQIHRRAPTLIGDGIHNADFVYVFGVPGHRIDLLDTSSHVTLARAAVGPTGYTRLRLSAPLRAGQVIQVRDLSNNEVSFPTTVTSRVASVYLLDRVTISTQDSTKVRAIGPGLTSAVRVRVGSEYVDFRRVDGKSIEFVAPPAPAHPDVDLSVAIELADGTVVNGPQGLVPDFSR